MIQNPIISGKKTAGTNSGWDVLEEVSFSFATPANLLETTCDYFQQLETYGDVCFAFFERDGGNIVLSPMPHLDITDGFLTAESSVYTGKYAATAIIMYISIAGDTDSNSAIMGYQIQFIGNSSGSTDIFTYFDKMQIVRIKI